MMPRHKVPDERRQRIAQACRGCQSRKQKCNGQDPCSGCHKRGYECKYDPPKKRKSGTRFLKHDNALASAHSSLSAPLPSVNTESAHSPQQPSLLDGSFLDEDLCDSPSDMSEWSGSSDVTSDMYESAATRIIHGQPGGNLYIGGSASSIFMDEIKRLVLPITGPCLFTQGPERYSITDGPADRHCPPVQFSLPHRDVAAALVDSACRYSAGMVEVLDAAAVQRVLQTCYSPPVTELSGSLCLLYLLLANGSITPIPLKEAELFGTPVLEDQEQADEYFELSLAVLNHLGGWEQTELWNAQAWVLMAEYCMSVSRWTAADSYIALAVRAAYALDIHQPQAVTSLADIGISNGVQVKLWQGIFVLDSFVAAYLGRPVAISKEAYELHSLRHLASSGLSNYDQCLDSNVLVSKSIRKILSLMYTTRQLPAKDAIKIINQNGLHIPNDQDRFEGEYAADNLAVLRARLFRNYAKMLVTRPFFLQHLFQSSKGRSPNRADQPWNSLSKTCVLAALDTAERLHSVHEMSRLPHCDSMWWPFLYPAVLTLLSNEFFDLHSVTDDASIVISQAFTVLEKCVARNSAARAEYDSLCSLRHLAEDRTRLSPCRPRPSYLDLPYASSGGYEGHAESSNISPVFATHEFASYCVSDSRRYSAPSPPTPPTPPDYLVDSTISPAETQIYVCPWDRTLPSTYIPRCSGDAGYYAFPAQQNGHVVGGAVPVTQAHRYTPYPDHHLC